MDDILHQKSRLKEQLQHSYQDNKSKVNPAPIAGEFTGTVESAAHTEQLLRFNAHQGHGFAAEQANDLLDTLHGSDASILGNDNAKNGADRMVDGLLIQTKYCQTAQASVDAAFNQQTKLYRYIDKNGVPMQLEVPSDQYDAAIQIMRKKIAAGQVPGVTDPNDAVNLVRKGNVTYQTACNIAKAGTVDSLAFDAAHGSVVAVSTFGISALITFAHSLWSGKNVEDAIDASMYVGLKMGGIGFSQYRDSFSNYEKATTSWWVKSATACSRRSKPSWLIHLMALLVGIFVWSAGILHAGATDVWVDHWDYENVDVYVMDDTISYGTRSTGRWFKVSTKLVQDGQLQQVIDWDFSKYKSDMWRYATNTMDGPHTTVVIVHNGVFEYAMNQIGWSYYIRNGGYYY